MVGSERLGSPTCPEGLPGVAGLTRCHVGEGSGAEIVPCCFHDFMLSCWRGWWC